MNAISAEFSEVSPLAQAKALFKQAFGEEPAWAVRAPGRVNLIGEHTDYNDGFVLPCAIDFHTVAAVTPRKDAVLRVVAHGHAHSPVSVALDQPLQPGSPVDWLDYVKAMWWAWQQTGRRLPGADAARSRPFFFRFARSGPGFRTARTHADSRTISTRDRPDGSARGE